MAIIIGQSAAGTTLSATVTATSQLTKTFNWTITKSVTPATWDLFVGDSGTSQYTVSVTKDAGTNGAIITGQVCVTNGGEFATENLNIYLGLEKLSQGGFQPVPNTDFIYEINLSDKPILIKGETFCYTYKITINNSNQVIPGNNYRVTANVTITNHSGHLGTPFGPSPKATTILPITATPIHNSIRVVDNFNATVTGITNSTSWNYTKTFTCNEAGTHKFPNTATIIFEDDNTTGGSATANVTLNCFVLNISKTVVPSHIRSYIWRIIKDVSESMDNGIYGNVITINMNIGEQRDAYYRVQVIPTPTDNFSVTGIITITNNAPIDAQLLGITDNIIGVTPPTNIPATVTCNNNSNILASGGIISCNYNATLPDMTNRTNTATVTIQNYNYDVNKVPTPSGTTTFRTNASISFINTPVQEIDETVIVSDNKYGPLGTANANNIASQTIFYSRQIGPYAMCGTPVDTDINTAIFITNDTLATGSDTATVIININCNGGCTHTIGYWKNHLSAIAPLLPIWLGTPNVGKSILVTDTSMALSLLNFSGDASNGINKLYAQLLAAKLNIKNGANPSAVSSTISAADATLALYNAADWITLDPITKQFIIDLANILDLYNNGLIGPGHCS